MLHFIEYRPPRIAMSFIILATAANMVLPLPLHAALAPAAIVTGLAGFALMIRAWWLFKQEATAICPTATATSLITRDVYSFTRNPMYLGMLLMLVALAMATGSTAFYVAAFGFGIVIDRVFCRHEEQKSLAEFGGAYLDYARRVRCWF